jgi:hypothetical protein
VAGIPDLPPVGPIPSPGNAGQIAALFGGRAIRDPAEAFGWRLVNSSNVAQVFQLVDPGVVAVILSTPVDQAGIIPRVFAEAPEPPDPLVQMLSVYMLKIDQFFPPEWKDRIYACAFVKVSFSLGITMDYFNPPAFNFIGETWTQG